MKLAALILGTWIVCSITLIHCQDPTTTSNPQTADPQASQNDPQSTDPPTTDNPETDNTTNGTDDDDVEKNRLALYGMSLVRNALVNDMRFIVDLVLDSMGRMAETCGCNRTQMEEMARDAALHAARAAGLRPDGGRERGPPLGRPEPRVLFAPPQNPGGNPPPPHGQNHNGDRQGHDRGPRTDPRAPFNPQQNSNPIPPFGGPNGGNSNPPFGGPNGGNSNPPFGGPNGGNSNPPFGGPNGGNSNPPFGGPNGGNSNPPFGGPNGGNSNPSFGGPNGGNSNPPFGGPNGGNSNPPFGGPNGGNSNPTFGGNPNPTTTTTTTPPGDITTPNAAPLEG